MKNFKEKIQQIVPMNLSSLVILIIIIYLMSVVGKTVWENYQSNKGINEQEEELFALEGELDYIENEIVYYQSQSFKEKQARAKLGYLLAGEKVLSLPKDYVEDGSKTDENKSGDVPEKETNLQLWAKYFSAN